MAQVNIKYILSDAYLNGVRPRLMPWGQPLEPAQWQAQTSTLTEADSLGGGNIKSLFFANTPVWDDVVLTNESTGESITLQYVIITATKPKKIIKNSIAGADNTIKEFINNDDFSIKLKGGIASNDGYFPSDSAKTLHALMSHNGLLKIESDFLNIFDINYIAVERFAPEMKEGQQNVLYFDIDAISDKFEDVVLLVR